MAIPIGTLFGMLFAIGRLAKDRELAVFQMTHIKSIRLFLPYLIIGLLLSLLSLFINEQVVPQVNNKAELVMRRIIFDNPPPELMKNVFFRDRDRFYYVGEIKPNSTQLQNIMIFEMRNGKMFKMTAAETGEREASVWNLHNGLNYEFDDAGHIKQESTYASIQLPVNNIDKSVYQLEKTAQDMNMAELRQFISTLKQQGIQTVSYEVDYYLKIANPLSTFIFALLGIPLISRIRGKEKLLMTGICIGIVLLYYILASSCAAAGRANLVSPILAAWIPNGLFMITGGILFWWVDND
jgi:lipopolysaccharide export system permease protein